MTFTNRMILGLPKAEKEAADFNEMRQEIMRAARDSSLIHNALTHAEWAGLSGEDKYTLLAYHALKALQVHFDLNMDIAMTTVRPVTIPASTPNTNQPAPAIVRRG